MPAKPKKVTDIAKIIGDPKHPAILSHQHALYITQNGTGKGMTFIQGSMVEKSTYAEKPKSPTEKEVMAQIEKHTPKAWYQKTWAELFGFKLFKKTERKKFPKGRGRPPR